MKYNKSKNKIKPQKSIQEILQPNYEINKILNLQISIYKSLKNLKKTIFDSQEFSNDDLQTFYGFESKINIILKKIESFISTKLKTTEEEFTNNYPFNEWNEKKVLIKKEETKITGDMLKNCELNEKILEYESELKVLKESYDDLQVKDMEYEIVIVEIEEDNIKLREEIKNVKLYAFMLENEIKDLKYLINQER